MGKKPRLLIVDDEIEICELIKEVGEQCGYEVTALTTGHEFLELSKDEDFTFIILDLSIPDYDGIELLRHLVKNNCTANIALASGQDEKVLSLATKLGMEMGLNMEHYFQKPIKLKELATLLTAKARTPVHTIDFLKTAIEEKNIVMHYQPKVSFSTRKIVGLEALIRLESNGELIPPSIFIPLAEESGLIRPLSHIIAERSLKEFSQILKTNPDIMISINISPKTFDDLLLPDEFTKIAHDNNVDTSKICLEITETAFMEHRIKIADIIVRFRIKGFILSIDDFGTGYASLSELHRLPFNELKIDQSFVLGLENDPDARIITHSVIHLAHNLGLEVTAEGIETKAAWDILEAQGCDIAQGYLISHPLGITDLYDWLDQHKKGFSPQ